jgi:hypothetical protein
VQGNIEQKDEDAYVDIEEAIEENLQVMVKQRSELVKYNC